MFVLTQAALMLASCIGLPRCRLALKGGASSSISFVVRRKFSNWALETVQQGERLLAHSPSTLGFLTSHSSQTEPFVHVMNQKNSRAKGRD